MSGMCAHVRACIEWHAFTCMYLSVVLIKSTLFLMLYFLLVLRTHNEKYTHELHTHTYIHTFIHSFIYYRQTDRQTDRQAGRQTGRQADRQTDRQAGRQIDRKPPVCKKVYIIFAAHTRRSVGRKQGQMSGQRLRENWRHECSNGRRMLSKLWA